MRDPGCGLRRMVLLRASVNRGLLVCLTALRGPCQYASSEYVERLEQAGARISMAAVRSPHENAKALERASLGT